MHAERISIFSSVPFIELQKFADLYVYVDKARTWQCSFLTTTCDTIGISMSV